MNQHLVRFLSGSQRHHQLSWTVSPFIGDSFYSTPYLDLEDLDLLGDLSASPHSAFSQLDEGLFESEDCEDILETIDLDESIFYQQVEDENSAGSQGITPEKRDSANSYAKEKVYWKKNILYFWF